MRLIDVLIAEATNPITLLLAVAGGILCQRWWHVLVVSLVIVTISEVLIFVVRPSHNFHATEFSVAALVPLLIVSLMLGIKKLRQ
jgi:uncharacterized membrane protein